MTKPHLRITLISEHASPLAPAAPVAHGSQRTCVTQVAQALAGAGHLVDVLARREHPGQAPQAHLWPGVRVLHLDAGPAAAPGLQPLQPRLDAFAAAALERLREGPPSDVLHAHGFRSGGVGLALRERLGVPLLTTLHGLGLGGDQPPGEDGDASPERISIERRLAHDSDRVVAQCAQDADTLIRRYGAPPARLRTVPCGVDMRTFRPGDQAAARRRLRLPLDRFIVLHTGRPALHKGVENLVRAMALLTPAGDAPAPLLLVVGADAPVSETGQPLTETMRLRQLVQHSGLSDRVRFVGRQDRAALRDWYLAADVYASTPWQTSFGVSVLEAMACARAVVGSPVGGIAECVVEGRTGHLVPARDPAALAARLEALRLAPERATAMGLAGAERAQRHYSWMQVARELIAVYDEVVPRPAPAQGSLWLVHPAPSRAPQASGPGCAAPCRWAVAPPGPLLAGRTGP